MKGYTLVELLVVMTIMSLIGLAAFINLGNFRQDKLLDSSLTNLQSVIRVAQSNASTGALCSGVGGANWSIEFKDSKTINLNCQASSQQNSINVSTTALGGDVQIQSINGDSGCSGAFPTIVNFLPVSRGITFTDLINTCIVPSQSLTVSLSKAGIQCVDNPSACRTVTINKGGSIN